MSSTCGDVVVEVDLRHGARLRRLAVAGLELLGEADVSGVPREILWGAFAMAPYAGRVRHGRFAFDGTAHELPLALAPHAIHGDGYDRAWAQDGENRARTDFSDRWPLGGWATQELRLDDSGLEVVLTVGNDERAMPASVGLHPWFRRRLERGGDVELELPAGQQWELDAEGLPSGRLVPPAPPPWDDCFTALTGPVVLRWPGALELRMTSDHPHWVVFTQLPEAVCVEPQSAPPDALNNGTAHVVGPGQPLTLTTRLEWTVSAGT